MIAAGTDIHDRTAHRPPSLQTLLGFDFGRRRIGVATGQTITGTATMVGHYGSALRFVVEGFTLGTFIGCDIEEIRGPEFAGTGRRGIALTVCLPGKLPVRPAFVNRGVRTFRFACTTVDAFIRDINGHVFLRYLKCCPQQQCINSVVRGSRPV